SGSQASSRRGRRRGRGPGLRRGWGHGGHLWGGDPMTRASPTALTWSHPNEGFKTLPEPGSLQPSIDRQRACNDRTPRQAELPLLREGRSSEMSRFIVRECDVCIVVPLPWLNVFRLVCGFPFGV